MLYAVLMPMQMAKSLIPSLVTVSSVSQKSTGKLLKVLSKCAGNFTDCHSFRNMISKSLLSHVSNSSLDQSYSLSSVTLHVA